MYTHDEPDEVEWFEEESKMQDMAEKRKKPADAKKPNRTGKAINVWIPEELYEAFKAFVAAQRVPPRITDTVELSLQEFLQREGFWPTK